MRMMIRGSDTEHRPMMMQLEGGCTCKIPCPARTEFSGPKFGHLVVCSRVNKKNRDEAEWVASVDGCSEGAVGRTGPDRVWCGLLPVFRGSFVSYFVRLEAFALVYINFASRETRGARSFPPLLFLNSF